MWSMWQRTDNDRRVVTSIVEDREATMKYAPSACVAKGLDLLYQRYVVPKLRSDASDIGREHALDQLYADNVAKLKQFIADHPVLNSERSVADAMLHISTIVNEPPTVLDRANFCVRDLDGSVKDRDLIFPLKHVLALVIRALWDSEQIALNYPDGEFSDLESKKTMAQDDLPRRVESLIRCFKDDLNGVCHHGVRNALFMLLVGIYPGIDEIIENIPAFTMSFLREKINTQFSQSFKIPESQPALMKALLLWLNENDATYLLEPLGFTIVDLQNELENKLIDRGVNLNKCGGDASSIIDTTLKNLEPNDDLPAPNISVLHAIFSRVSTRNHSLHADALDAVKNWIVTNFDINNQTHICYKI